MWGASHAVVVRNGRFLHHLPHFVDREIDVDLIAVEFFEDWVPVVVNFFVVLHHDLPEIVNWKLFEDSFIVFVDVRYVPFDGIPDFPHHFIRACDRLFLFLNVVYQRSIEFLVLLIDFVDQGFKVCAKIWRIVTAGGGSITNTCLTAMSGFAGVRALCFRCFLSVPLLCAWNARFLAFSTPALGRKIFHLLRHRSAHKLRRIFLLDWPLGSNLPSCWCGRYKIPV